MNHSTKGGEERCRKRKEFDDLQCDMYNLYGTIRRVLFEGRKAERAAMLSELIKMQGGNIGGSAKVETPDDRLKLARELENINDGEEVILFKDKSGKLVWVRLNGEKWA